MAPENRQLSQLPPTQGIKYAGSKLKLLPQILELCEYTGSRSVLDGFSGTTRVSQSLSSSGYIVHSNDVSDWSFPMATCFLQNHLPHSHYQPLIDELNALPPKNGWFTQHYGGDTTSDKKPWQIHNTQKLDAIRDAIDHMQLKGIDRALALTSLMLAMDEVDSTLGHHASYLREWSKRSYRTMQLKVPNYQIQPDASRHTVTQNDIFEIAATTPCELAYYDPPYGSNNEKMPPSRVRYAAYYHLWTSICRHDKPEVFGKVGRRKDSSDVVVNSVFEDFRKTETGRYRVIEAIERLLKITPCEWILLSYSSGGRATSDQLQDCMQSYGILEKTITVNYQKHIMASMQSDGAWLRDTDDGNREFLFLIRKK